MSIDTDVKCADVRGLVQQMAGRRLPSERDLAEQLKISRPRLRAILAALESEGLVQRRQGSGTYAVDSAAPDLNKVVLLIDTTLKLGEDPFFSLLVERLQQSVQAIGAACIIERIMPKRRPQSFGDGAITLGLAGQAIIEDLRAQDPPVVGLFLPEAARSKGRASVFQAGDREAGELAGQRAIDLGCEHVVYVGRSEIPASYERLAGVQRAVSRAGLPLRVVECSMNYTACLQMGSTMSLPPDGRVGVVTANDWLALGMHAGLLRREDSISQRMAIISFDGLPMAANPLLKIDSLAMPIDMIAGDAVAELRRLRQPGPNAGRIVRYQMSWR